MNTLLLRTIVIKAMSVWFGRVMEKTSQRQNKVKACSALT